MISSPALWGVVAEQVSEHDQRLSQYLNQKGLRNELRALSIPQCTDPLEFSRDLLWVRVPSPRSSELLSRSAVTTQDCRELEFCDGFLRMQKQVWPRNSLLMALSHTFAEIGTMDQSKHVLIVGASGRARTAAAAAVKLGFKKIMFVAPDPAPEVEHTSRLLAQNYFASQFEVLASERLIEIASAFQMCIFANDEKLDPSFRTELSFFNFLTSDGFVLDLTSEVSGSELLEATQEANVRVIPAQVPGSYVDSTWVEWALNASVDVTELRAAVYP